MKRDILSYNLSGMGCSAGLLAIDLARELLNSRAKSTALVISTEIITQNLYRGNERSMLLQNTLFRAFFFFFFLFQFFSENFSGS